MSAEENKQFVTDALAALNSGDAEKFLDALSDDVRFTLIGSTSYSGTYEGKQAFVSDLVEKLVGELDGGIELRPQNIVAEGDHVVVEAQGKARTKSGQDYNNTYCIVYRLAGGKIVEAHEYLDTELVTRVLG